MPMTLRPGMTATRAAAFIERNVVRERNDAEDFTARCGLQSERDDAGANRDDAPAHAEMPAPPPASAHSLPGRRPKGGRHASGGVRSTGPAAAIAIPSAIEGGLNPLTCLRRRPPPRRTRFSAHRAMREHRRRVRAGISSLLARRRLVDPFGEALHREPAGCSRAKPAGAGKLIGALRRRRPCAPFELCGDEDQHGAEAREQHGNHDRQPRRREGRGSLREEERHAGNAAGPGGPRPGKAPSPRPGTARQHQREHAHADCSNVCR